MAVTPGAVTGNRRGMFGRAQRRNHALGWLFATPFTALFVVFMLAPMLVSLVLSFTDFGVGNLVDPLSAEVIGFENYTAVFSDAEFRSAALNTTLIVVVGVPLTLAIGLLLAVALDKGIWRMRALFRVGYYLPVVTTIVAIAVIWRYLLNADIGLINNLLSAVGIEGPSWLANRSTALPVIILIVVWRNIGTPMVIYLAALQGIDPQLYEAAKVDGAGSLALFRRITLPMLRPATLFLTVITSAGYLQVFDEPFVMTRGGPLNSTLTVNMIAYEQGFKFFKLGYASSISYLLFAAIAILTVVQFRMLRTET